MRILEIALDGFKSYAARTVIQGFDEHFNAITGFNGSGKSNILDAICFVLGISTLATVRVANKQELIYKNGQAGITKANVTILFDNSDKTRCHEAYKKFDMISVRREFSVGGGSKCTINGTTVTNEKVLQLFSMSGLNVNNANFLIMQGRITQVINMKPQEILSLVEETAGTNAYEEIKKKTVKLVEKKDAKLMDIENILNQEVIPIMEQLMKENEEYNKWRTLCLTMEVLEKKVKAATYYEIREQLMNTEAIQKNYADVLKDLEKKEKHLIHHIKELEKQKHEMMEKESKLISSEDKKKLDDLKVKKDQLEANLDSKQKEKEQWEKKRLGLLKDIEKNNLNSVRKATALQRANDEIVKQKDNQVDLKKNLENLKGMLLSIERGGSIEENYTEIRKEELVRKKDLIHQEMTAKSNGIQSMNMKLESRQKELQNAKNLENFDFTGINRDIEDLEKKLKSLRTFNEEEFAGITSEKTSIEQEILRVNKSMERFDHNRYALRYEPPERNFDHSRIKGRVIKLIRLTDEKYARALEAGAGSRLFSIVVDTDVTGQLLLSRKTFGNVSILPNNKTIPSIIPNEIVERVNSTFRGRAHLALSLINYNRENHNSIGFVFGGFFVCETKEIAEKIAYDQHYGRIAVTLDGDTYNPSGIMSGGESNNRPSALAEYCSYQEKELLLEKAQKKLNDVNKTLIEVEKQREKYLSIKNELDIKKLNKSNREKALQESSSAKLTSEIEEIEHTIVIYRADIDKLKKDDKSIDKEINDLKRQSMSNPKDVLMKNLSKAESELKKNSDLVRKIQNEINQHESEIESIGVEVKEMQEKVNKLTEDLKANETNTENISNEISTVDNKLQQVKIHYETKINELMRNKEICAEIQEELHKNSRDYEDLKKEKGNIENKRQSLQKDNENNLKTLEELEAKHPYIANMEAEIQNFDKATAKDELEHLQSECERQSKRVNKKVSSTLDDHQKRYSALTAKKSIVMQDKDKLLYIIRDLDVKKQECIEDTSRKVDQNLGEIYSMLLPGATAKLESVDDFKGLEMRVAFNNDWKENLGELSGGQRSLLALSFILALLKVNPAPIYILDEIDAALDMSHTQNIGLMLSTHFSQSQFIVVSLKEGMFTNANVLFKTQFVDGKSVVERHVLGSSIKESKNRRIFK